jgi:glycosyltransferase involved in cell wall biosynthesis
MVTETISTAPPLFSIVIAVYNDWLLLDRCLRSLAQQRDAPDFEVIIVDDGSRQPAPGSVRDWSSCYPLKILEQAHAGISAARNQGIRASRGAVLVFVDADCKPQNDCLAVLGTIVKDSPEHNSFQLHLTGDCSGALGRAEALRLMILQNHMLQPNGCIRYLNTAGFAIRRAIVNVEQGLFDPVVLRGEDTLLLATLMQRGELPLFVVDAIVQHCVSSSLMECACKDIKAAYWLGRTYQISSSMGVRIRTNQRERLRMLLSALKTSRERSMGMGAWSVLVARLTLRNSILLLTCISRVFSRDKPKQSGLTRN